MKRVVVPEPLKVAIEDAERPVPGRGEVLVRTLATGISAGTEMGLYRGTNVELVGRRWGELGTYPVYPGYISVAVVTELGPDVDGLSVGDRVLSHAAHAEYDVIAADGTVLVPDGIDDDTATCAGLGSTALHGVTRADIQPGDVVAVVGTGMAGQMAIQHARIAGATTTIAVDTDPFRLDVAASLGATHTVNPKTEDAVEAVKRYSDGGPDVVIEIAGAPAAVPLALSLARDKGRVVIVGWHIQPVELVLAEDFLYKELEVRASRGSGPDGTAGRRDVVSRIADGRIKTDGLVTHVFPFQDVLQAYELIRTGSEPSLHVVLRWS